MKRERQPTFSKLLVIEHVGEILGVSPRTIRRLIEKGEIRPCRFGRSVRVHPDDLADEDGRRSLSIDLEGALAGVLALAMNGKTPLTGSGSSDAVIALVAGAGFEPATFRL
jgi:excisionase family DNA binding protein